MLPVRREPPCPLLDARPVVGAERVDVLALDVDEAGDAAAGDDRRHELRLRAAERGQVARVGGDVADDHRLAAGRGCAAEAAVGREARERGLAFAAPRDDGDFLRADGSLDVDEEDLARLDWVVASVHASRETNPTERALAAMEHPYVDCIGHLTGRKIGKRGPTDVDVERVIEKALETGTFLEINSQADRLDLRDVHARAAKEAGLRLAINSDAHQIRAQGYVELGIGQARRGWLTKDDVLNTRTWPQIRKLRKKKR